MGMFALFTKEIGRRAFNQACLNSAKAFVQLNLLWIFSFSVSCTDSSSPAAPTIPPYQDEINQAANWLQAQIQPDGKVTDARISAWTALAFGANGNTQAALINYLKNYSPSTVTDYARQILAAVAAGEDPKDFGGTDLISSLKSLASGNRFGTSTTINYDIFAVIALIAAKEDPSSSLIEGSITAVLNAQEPDGSFVSSVDTAAAAISALKAYQRSGGTQSIDTVCNATLDYLRTTQQADGGFAPETGASFSSSGSTAWVIQALTAAGQDINKDWRSSNAKTPFDLLLSLQQPDGSFLWSQGGAADAWSTSLVIPALLKKPWPIIP